jgi:hypothetical protein
MVRRFALQNRIPLSLTQLEDRCVPAGNVLAQMVGSTLLITGDELDNDVDIVGIFGEASVRGFNDTSVNGALNDGLTFPGVERVAVFTGDGDDSVWCTWNMLDAAIVTGNGDDRVNVRSWYMTGALEVSTGDGRDEIQVITDFHTGSVHVDAGNGHDLVSVGVEWVDGDLAVDAGNGNDAVVLYVSDFLNRIGYVTGDLNVEGGNGKDDTLTGLSSVRWIIVVEGGVSISGFEEIV